MNQLVIKLLYQSKQSFARDILTFFNLAGSEGLHLTYGPGCPSFCSAGCRRISSLIKLSSRYMVGRVGFEPNDPSIKSRVP